MVSITTEDGTRAVLVDNGRIDVVELFGDTLAISPMYNLSGAEADEVGSALLLAAEVARS